MNLSEKRICASCVAEEYLHDCISKAEDIDTCSYCGEKNNTVSLEWLAEIVHNGIQEHFHPTSTEPSGYEYALLADKEIDYIWYREGQPVNDLLQDIVDIDEPLTIDLQQYLSDTNTDFDDMAAREEDPYGDEVHYEETPAEQYNAIESWKTPCTEVKSRARFFSPVTEKILDELLGDLNTFKAYDGVPVVKIISPSGENSTLYRARIAQSNSDIENILMAPVRELGAPYTKYANAGRMNPAGISVFYGATDASTCIAEIRPPVGSHVVIGEFNVIREIRLLDMDILSKLHIKGSYFNPESGAEWGRAAFLRQIVDELTKPILPDDEVIEYLPTQVIAEYLSEKIDPRLDGIIYHTSQTIDEGKNIVLFNHASLTEPYTLPDNTKVTVDLGHWAGEDDYDDSIVVWEKTHEAISEDTSNEDSKSNLVTFDPIDIINDFGTNLIDESVFENREVTLKLDVDIIDVRKISGSIYDADSRSTSRYRSKSSDDSKF